MMYKENIKLKDIDETIKYLKEQDLSKYGVSLGLKGKRDCEGYECYPYRVEGHLYNRETFEFLVKVEVTQQVFNRGDKRGIKRIREEVGY